MPWCRQATSHYLSQCWPRSMLPHCITRPQWVITNLHWKRSDWFHGHKVPWSTVWLHIQYKLLQLFMDDILCTMVPLVLPPFVSWYHRQAADWMPWLETWQPTGDIYNANLKHKLRSFLPPHDNLQTWKYTVYYWPFVRGIHQSLVDSPLKGPEIQSVDFVVVVVVVRLNKLLKKIHAVGDLRYHNAHMTLL